MPKDKTTPPRANSASTKLNRTEQRQKERLAEQRRQRFMIGGIVLAAVVILGVALRLASNSPAEAPIPETVSRYDGLPQVITTDKGYPRLGSLDGIAVTVYTAFACETCRAFQNDVMPALIERVRAGDISLTFVPLRGGTISNPNGAVRSALCAGQQNAFFQYADALYHWLDLYEGDAFRDNRLTTGAENLGLNMAAFGQCRSSAPENAAYNAGATELTGVANAGTPPLVRVNNILLESTDLVAINEAIDAAISFREGTSTEEDSSGDIDATTEPEATDESSATEAADPEPTEAATDEPAETPVVEPTATDS
jgi:hypothetical protein